MRGIGIKTIYQPTKRSASMQENRVTKEKFKAYVSVQKSGQFNMFDPRAREMANTLMKDDHIEREDWISIIQNYKKYENEFSA
tara:strand:- start:54 stop:302 length:249 start_codon:yes stop_codon:yes gene_type:complete